MLKTSTTWAKRKYFFLPLSRLRKSQFPSLPLRLQPICRHEGVLATPLLPSSSQFRFLLLRAVPVPPAVMEEEQRKLIKDVFGSSSSESEDDPELQRIPTSYPSIIDEQLFSNSPIENPNWLPITDHHLCAYEKEDQCGQSSSSAFCGKTCEQVCSVKDKEELEKYVSSPIIKLFFLDEETLHETEGEDGKERKKMKKIQARGSYTSGEVGFGQTGGSRISREAGFLDQCL